VRAPHLILAVAALLLAAVSHARDGATGGSMGGAAPAAAAGLMDGIDTADGAGDADGDADGDGDGADGELAAAGAAGARAVARPTAPLPVPPLPVPPLPDETVLPSDVLPSTTEVLVPFFRTMLMLGVVLLFIWLTLHKGMGKLVQRAQAGKRVKVVERVALDARRSLYLVEVDGQSMLIGGGDGVNHLVTLDGHRPGGTSGNGLGAVAPASTTPGLFEFVRGRAGRKPAVTGTASRSSNGTATDEDNNPGADASSTTPAAAERA
jgi:hypothetical protein